MSQRQLPTATALDEAHDMMRRGQPFDASHFIEDYWGFRENGCPEPWRGADTEADEIESAVLECTAM